MGNINALLNKDKYFIGKFISINIKEHNNIYQYIVLFENVFIQHKDKKILFRDHVWVRFDNFYSLLPNGTIVETGCLIKFHGYIYKYKYGYYGNKINILKKDTDGKTGYGIIAINKKLKVFPAKESDGCIYDTELRPG